ncbi:MAG: HupE/UreJ family protein, partial [Solirubrobacterales bacterium]
MLFLASLTLLSARPRDIVAVIAIFAVSYSSTLIGGAVLGIAVPGSVIDTIIAISVGYVGAQIAFGGDSPWLTRNPRAPALVFGLAHGLGLSTLVQELRLPGDAVLPSAIGFNVGVEAGQVAVIGLLLGALALAGAVPFPARQRIPAGCALISASIALTALVFWSPPAALAHTAQGPPPPTGPPPVVSEVPEPDQDRYRSRVSGIVPPVPGLEARILGNQEKLEVTWTGRRPLVVIGTQGEPMLRFSDAGVEINEVSPSAYLSADRYAEVALPGDVNPQAPPRWKLID